MKTLARQETLVITTSESHVRAVARNFDTELYAEHGEIVTRRHVDGLGTLVYRGVMVRDLIA